MSEVMNAVLTMPDALFWSDEPMIRAQHNRIRFDAAKEIEELRAALDERNAALRTAVEAMETCGEYGSREDRTDFLDYDQAKIQQALTLCKPLLAGEGES